MTNSHQGIGDKLNWTSFVLTPRAHHFPPWFSSVQSLSPVWLFVTPWTAACQASPSITNSRRLLKLMSIESVMPSNYLILCHTLLLPPSIFPSIIGLFQWVSSSYQVAKALSFSISPSNEYSGLISFRIGWFDLLTVLRTGLGDEPPETLHTP